MNLNLYPRTLGKYIRTADDISHLVADINYTHVFLKNGKTFLVSYTIKRFEELLSEFPVFKRIHRGVIVNTSQIVKTSAISVTLKNGIVFPIARRREV